MTIYAVPIMLQEAQIKHYCFDRCGKVIFSGLDDSKMGPCSFCHEDTCPFLRKQMDEAVGKVHGELVYFRALKLIEPEERTA